MFSIFKSDIALEIHDNITSLLRYLFDSMPQCTASEIKSIKLCYRLCLRFNHL